VTFETDVRTQSLKGRPRAWCGYCEAKSMPGRRKTGKFMSEHFDNGGMCLGRAEGPPQMELVEDSRGRLVPRRIR
jgi:hypothetical protein